MNLLYEPFVSLNWAPGSLYLPVMKKSPIKRLLRELKNTKDGEALFQVVILIMMAILIISLVILV